MKSVLWTEKILAKIWLSEFSCRDIWWVFPNRPTHTVCTLVLNYHITKGLLVNTLKKSAPPNNSSASGALNRCYLEGVSFILSTTLNTSWVLAFRKPHLLQRNDQCWHVLSCATPRELFQKWLTWTVDSNKDVKLTQDLKVPSNTHKQKHWAGSTNTRPTLTVCVVSANKKNNNNNYNSFRGVRFTVLNQALQNRLVSKSVAVTRTVASEQ